MTARSEREKEVEDYSRRTSESGQSDETLRVLDDAEAHGVCY
jgi:hypothetical protein